MTKQDFIDGIHSACKEEGLELSKKAVKAVVDKTIGGMSDCMKNGDEILLLPLGRFGTKFRKARKATNLVTGEALDVPAKYVPNFAPATELKKAVAEIKA